MEFLCNSSVRVQNYENGSTNYLDLLELPNYPGLAVLVKIQGCLTYQPSFPVTESKPNKISRKSATPKPIKLIPALKQTLRHLVV